jgi:hypothetical protein
LETDRRFVARDMERLLEKILDLLARAKSDSCNFKTKGVGMRIFTKIFTRPLGGSLNETA